MGKGGTYGLDTVPNNSPKSVLPDRPRCNRLNCQLMPARHKSWPPWNCGLRSILPPFSCFWSTFRHSREKSSRNGLLVAPHIAFLWASRDGLAHAQETGASPGVWAKWGGGQGQCGWLEGSTLSRMQIRLAGE